MPQSVAQNSMNSGARMLLKQYGYSFNEATNIKHRSETKGNARYDISTYTFDNGLKVEFKCLNGPGERVNGHTNMPLDYNITFLENDGDKIELAPGMHTTSNEFNLRAYQNGRYVGGGSLLGGGSYDNRYSASDINTRLSALVHQGFNLTNSYTAGQQLKVQA